MKNFINKNSVLLAAAILTCATVPAIASGAPVPTITCPSLTTNDVTILYSNGTFGPWVLKSASHAGSVTQVDMQTPFPNNGGQCHYQITMATASSPTQTYLLAIE